MVMTAGQNGQKKKRRVLRGGLDPTPYAEPTKEKPTEKRVAWEVMKEALPSVVSEYWAWEVARNNPYSPDTPCKCRFCKKREHKGWPGPSVMAISRYSWECAWERTLARKPGKWTPPIAHPEEVTNRWESIPEAEAIKAGLSLVHRRRPTQAEDDGIIGAMMVPGCERCEGLRINGERFCLQCWAALIKENGGEFDVEAE